MKKIINVAFRFKTLKILLSLEPDNSEIAVISTDVQLSQLHGQSVAEFVRRASVCKWIKWQSGIEIVHEAAACACD